MKNRLAWFMFALLIILGAFSAVWWCLPGFALTLLIQGLATAIILASLRILVGMCAVISFGHALYVGIGAYGAAHLMLFAQKYGFFVPLWLVPLAGGGTGLLMAVVAGWLSTRRANSIYTAMVTLALCELVHALAQVWPTVFGDESGLQIDRTTGNFWGLDFADERLMVMLCLGYACVCLWWMYRFTRTPLGKWLTATREDAVRVTCLGVYPQRIQYFAFLISGFFAGIGGALLMLEFEAAQSPMLGAVPSGSYLMFTYLGGIGSVVGSLIGAVMQVFGTVWLPSLSAAWELYLGCIFIYAVLRWPHGIIGALKHAIKQWQEQVPQRGIIALEYVGRFSFFMSFICMVELFYRVWSPFIQQTWLEGLKEHLAWFYAGLGLLTIGIVSNFARKYMHQSSFEVHAQRSSS